ncbi:MAG TPA: polyprenyl synthetase family protein [Gemmatimonadales bacterium]|nr:polyprenyl synthetase family protein [Gemmatimonadales bacterium]
MPRQAASVTLLDIQRPVAEALDTVTAEIGRMIAADVPLMQEVNRHLLLMKGKLFRPTLLLLTDDACATGDPRAVSLAAIVELIHLATLVHDDSVDHSVLRRGMPTVNTLFSHQVSVIMGDYLYSRAIIELARLDDLEPIRVLARVTDAMTVGEMRQLAAYDALDFDEQQYELLCRSKTASLFAAACEVGALRAEPVQRLAARRYGDALGMAFQITDDLLDYTEGEAVTGKPSGLDLREHKVTLPLIAVLSRLSPAQRQQVEALFRQAAPDDEQVVRVVQLVEQHGGLEYARDRAAAFAAEAEAALDDLPSSSARDALRDAIVYAVERRR